MLRAIALLLAFLITDCATSPMGRKQLMLMPDSQVNEQGVQAFTQVKQQTPVSKDPRQNQFVDCVANAVTNAAKSRPNAPSQWEIVVFNDPKTVNAFALPGGKIGVYSGILPVTKTDGQLAAVLAHETGHVLSRHGAERMSQALAEQGGLMAAGVASGNNPAISAALGLGAQVGLVLPFSRTQENEADLVGLQLMAEAGFDPHQAIDLWKNMEATGGKAPPQILSDHPSDPNRIAALEEHMPDAVTRYNAARAAGKDPHCTHP